MIVGQIVLEKYAKFGDPCSNRSQEIPPEAVESGIFDSLFRYNFRREVDNDVVSGVAIDYVHVQFGDTT